MEGINLLPQQTENEIKSGVYRRKINVTALVTLGVIGAIIVAIIAYQIFLKIRANDITARTEKAETKIQDNQDIEITNLALKEKVDKIEQILTSEIPTSVLIHQVGVDSATSTPIKITNITSSASGETFVDGTADNSAIFSQWIDNLTSDSSKEFFSKINLVSLNRSTEGNYKFSFKMTFLKKGVYQEK